MGDGHRAESDIDLYAGIAVEIADGAGDPEVVLARHGLDEARWDAIDNGWQARLAEATDEGVEDGIPPLLAAYAQAMARAQKARAGAGVASFERFAEAMRLFQRSGDMPATLQRTGLTLQDFLRASQHWTSRLAVEPDLAAKFERLLRQ